jgi:hypothetical protein
MSILEAQGKSSFTINMRDFSKVLYNQKQ